MSETEFKQEVDRLVKQLGDNPDSDAVSDFLVQMGSLASSWYNREG